MSFGRMGAMGHGFSKLGSGGATANIALSAAAFNANAAIGTVIGTLSVIHGFGSYTFTLTSNPGSLFSITSNQLKVNNASIGAGSYPVTIQANNGAGSIISRQFTLVASAGAGPSLVFSSPTNSQYIGTVIH